MLTCIHYTSLIQVLLPMAKSSSMITIKTIRLEYIERWHEWAIPTKLIVMEGSIPEITHITKWQYWFYGAFIPLAREESDALRIWSIIELLFQNLTQNHTICFRLLSPSRPMKCFRRVILGEVFFATYFPRIRDQYYTPPPKASRPNQFCRENNTLAYNFMMV